MYCNWKRSGKPHARRVSKSQLKLLFQHYKLLQMISKFRARNYSINKLFILHSLHPPPRPQLVQCKGKKKSRSLHIFQHILLQFWMFCDELKYIYNFLAIIKNISPSYSQIYSVAIGWIITNKKNLLKQVSYNSKHEREREREIEIFWGMIHFCWEWGGGAIPGYAQRLYSIYYMVW